MDGWLTPTLAPPRTEQTRPVQVSILLPTYNEELAIRRVLDEIVEAMSRKGSGNDEGRMVNDSGGVWSARISDAAQIGNLDYEILVVDDGSTDRTAEIAEQFALECWQCPVRVVRCPENRGAGAARKVGVWRLAAKSW